MDQRLSVQKSESIAMCGLDIHAKNGFEAKIVMACDLAAELCERHIRFIHVEIEDGHT